jgi:hypothetical protein
VCGTKGQEDENRQRVRPPQQTAGFPAIDEGGEIGGHQQKNQQRDDSRFRRQRPQPFRPDHKSTKRQTRDRNGNRDGEDRGNVEIERAEEARATQKTEMRRFGEMVGRDQRENAEAPEHQRVSDARQGPLGNHFPLQHYFPDEIGDPAAHRLDVENRRLSWTADDTPDCAKSPPKTENGSCEKNEEQGRLRPGQLGHYLRV